MFGLRSVRRQSVPNAAAKGACMTTSRALRGLNSYRCGKSGCRPEYCLKSRLGDLLNGLHRVAITAHRRLTEQRATLAILSQPHNPVCEPQLHSSKPAASKHPEPPTGLPRPVKQARKLACEPLLQTGQARLGALVSRCRGLACEPLLQTGQARLGAWGSRCRE